MKLNFAVTREYEKGNRKMRLSELVADIKLKNPEGIPGLEISGISVDSRNVRPGDLFIAVPGHAIDGRQFVSEAISLGAVAVLTAPGKKLNPGVPVLTAENFREAVANTAARFFNFPSKSLKVAGITGTDGKTTTVYLLAHIFNKLGLKCGKIGTIIYDTGKRQIPAGNTTPGPVDIQRYLAEMLNEGMSHCAMEVSSHAIDQGRNTGVSFSTATFTNLSQDHLDYHKEMESYFSVKLKLFENAPVSVINIDDDYGKRMLDMIRGRVFTYGTKDADLIFRSIKSEINKSVLEFNYNDESVRFDFPLPGIFNQMNAAAAAATALGSGLSLTEIAGALTEKVTVPGRLQPIALGQPFGVYVDYAHTPGALKRLLTSVRVFSPKKIHIVFGCGGDRDAAKRPLMARAASEFADFVYLTSDNPRTETAKAIIEDALPGITDKKKCQVIEDRAQAIKAAISAAGEGEIVIIAGKGHEDYQIIGTVKKYFSDVEIAKSELRKLGYE